MKGSKLRPLFGEDYFNQSRRNEDSFGRPVPNTNSDNFYSVTFAV